MQTLTTRQQQVLELIRSWLQQHGAPPTRVEIAQALGFRSATAAEDHLRALARKGYLELSRGRNRNIRLLHSLPQTDADVPLIGQVAAGSPLLAVENIECHVGCAGLFQPRADYLLRVRGDSMIEAGVDDGDLLAVHKTPQAQDGDIVVARLGDEVTVKTLQRSGQDIRLLPANPAYAPIEIDPVRDALAIEGVAVGVIRPQLKRFTRA